MFSALREQKKREIRDRGLMSFVQDSAQDIEGIRAVAAMLEQLDGLEGVAAGAPFERIGPR